MRTLFIGYADENELNNLDQDLEFLFISELTVHNKYVNFNLPVGLKFIIVDIIICDNKNINLDIKPNDLEYKIPFGCVMKINNNEFSLKNYIKKVSVITIIDKNLLKRYADYEYIFEQNQAFKCLDFNSQKELLKPTQLFYSSYIIL
jgi:hypothetical protein